MLQAVWRCRRWTSAPGATKLVLIENIVVSSMTKILPLKIFWSHCWLPLGDNVNVCWARIQYENLHKMQSRGLKRGRYKRLRKAFLSTIFWYFLVEFEYYGRNGCIFNPLRHGGGVKLTHTFFDHLLLLNGWTQWNETFWLFLNIKNKNFGHNLSSNFSTLPPHGGGV